MHKFGRFGGKTPSFRKLSAGGALCNLIPHRWRCCWPPLWQCLCLRWRHWSWTQVQRLLHWQGRPLTTWNCWWRAWLVTFGYFGWNKTVNYTCVNVTFRNVFVGRSSFSKEMIRNQPHTVEFGIQKEKSRFLVKLLYEKLLWDFASQCLPPNALCFVHDNLQGLARTQIPTNINYAVEFPTFGEIAGVNPTEVQWKGLALEEPP